MVPRLLLGAVGWLVVGAAVPWPGGWLLVGVLVAGVVAAAVAEPLLVRLLWLARTPSTPIIVPGSPKVVVLVTWRRPVVAIAGRSHLVVSAAADFRSPGVRELLERASLQQRLAAGQLDVIYRWLAMPWLLVAALAGGIGSIVTRLPLVGFAWTLRPVVTMIAIAQSVADGRWTSALVITIVIGLTYLLPWTREHQQRVVEHTAASGVGPTRPSVEPLLDEVTDHRAPLRRHDRRRPAGGRRVYHQRIASRAQQRGW